MLELIEPLPYRVPCTTVAQVLRFERNFQGVRGPSRRDLRSQAGQPVRLQPRHQGEVLPEAHLPDAQEVLTFAFSTFLTGCHHFNSSISQH